MIKKFRKKFYLIACDGALYYLLNKKIIPDLVVTLDPHPSRIVRWFGDKTLNLKTIQSLFLSVIMDGQWEKKIMFIKIRCGKKVLEFL